MNSNSHKFFLKSFLFFIGLLSASLAIAMNEPGEFEMPFGLSMATDTRVVDVAQYYVGTIKEANGRLATKGTAKEVISFYEKELEKIGFRIFSKTDNAKRISIAAKRGEGDFFSLSNYGDNYGLEAGETELRIIVRYAP